MQTADRTEEVLDADHTEQVPFGSESHLKGQVCARPSFKLSLNTKLPGSNVVTAGDAELEPVDPLLSKVPAISCATVVSQSEIIVDAIVKRTVLSNNTNPSIRSSLSKIPKLNGAAARNNQTMERSSSLHPPLVNRSSEQNRSILGKRPREGLLSEPVVVVPESGRRRTLLPDVIDLTGPSSMDSNMVVNRRPSILPCPAPASLPNDVVGQYIPGLSCDAMSGFSPTASGSSTRRTLLGGFPGTPDDVVILATQSNFENSRCDPVVPRKRTLLDTMSIDSGSASSSPILVTETKKKGRLDPDNNITGGVLQGSTAPPILETRRKGLLDADLVPEVVNASPASLPRTRSALLGDFDDMTPIKSSAVENPDGRNLLSSSSDTTSNTCAMSQAEATFTEVTPQLSAPRRRPLLSGVQPGVDAPCYSTGVDAPPESVTKWNATPHLQQGPRRRQLLPLPTQEDPTSATNSSYNSSRDGARTEATRSTQNGKDALGIRQPIYASEVAVEPSRNGTSSILRSFSVSSTPSLFASNNSMRNTMDPNCAAAVMLSKFPEAAANCDIRQLKAILTALLDEPSSILHRDADKKRRVMELIPLLDNLETLLSMGQNVAALNLNEILKPVIAFVKEIADLSTAEMRH